MAKRKQPVSKKKTFCQIFKKGMAKFLMAGGVSLVGSHVCCSKRKLEADEALRRKAKLFITRGSLRCLSVRGQRGILKPCTG
jgi:hypothetical protein